MTTQRISAMLGKLASVMGQETIVSIQAHMSRIELLYTLKFNSSLLSFPCLKQASLGDSQWKQVGAPIGPLFRVGCAISSELRQQT